MAKRRTEGFGKKIAMNFYLGTFEEFEQHILCDLAKPELKQLSAVVISNLPLNVTSVLSDQ